MILLDTHIWVRWVDPAVSPLPFPIIERIETGDRLAVSASSCWEVAWLARRGRVELKLDLDEWLDLALQGSQVECVPLDRSTAVRAASLTEHHRDPVDRFVIATAIERQASVISFDAAFPAYVELTGRLIDRVCRD